VVNKAYEKRELNVQNLEIFGGEFEDFHDQDEELPSEMKNTEELMRHLNKKTLIEQMLKILDFEGHRNQ